MVDALVSGTSDRKVVEVQVLSSAPHEKGLALEVLGLFHFLVTI